MKIVQISATPTGNPNSFVVFGLDADGKLYRYNYGSHMWEQQ